MASEFSTTGQSDAAKPVRIGRRILIVRPTALGDVSRTVPALATLRRAFPDARIDWLIHEAYADVIRHHPALDGLVLFPRGRFGQIAYNPAAAGEAWAWARRLRAARYDLAIDLQGLLRSGIFTWITGAAKRVGFADAREGAHLAYNRAHHIDPGLHTVDRMLALLAAEGLAVVPDMRLYPGRQDMAWLDDFLTRQGDHSESLQSVASGQTNGREPLYACLAPTAQWRSKCWPLERYAQLAQRLLKHDAVGRRVIVLAAEHERPYVAGLLEQLGRPARLHLPATTLGQMMAILSRARLAVCNDSGPLHIAAGLGRPLVAIFGPTDPARVGPYGRLDAVVRPANVTAQMQQHYRRHRDDQSLMAQVAVDQVWERIRQLLGEGLGAGIQEV